MSSQHQLTASGGTPRPEGGPPRCLRCNRPMAMRQVSPVLFAPDVDDVTYGCEECGTQAKRSVKRT
jgi:hypothetical protein